ncbi:MAG: ABC transporter permease [Bacillota bacterium]|jgi:peptide/nickel transport system permease protein|nr:ABC transporter permease [Bacillota bacterium]NLJ02274.1 ABC transporter permease [Bacillota bacterium]
MEHISQGKKVWRRFRRSKLAVFGMIVLIFFVLLSIFAPFLTDHDPNRSNLRNRNLPPSREHLFGTDDMGRDVFARTLYGGRISLTVGLVSVGISLGIGVVLGAVAGFFGGLADTIIMRIADVFYSFPFMILAITISSIFGPSIYNTMIILGVLSWPSSARLLRAEFLKLKQTDFSLAAATIGAGPARVMFRHILPNAVSPLLVSATLGVASAILSEAGLSFLGLGVPPPAPSWGNMLNRARPLHILATMPWMWLPPGIAIFVVVLSINFVGDGLRDALDPRQVMD